MTSDDDKISGIYQQGKEQGPPAHLDDTILKAAREAVEEVPSVGDLSVVKGPFSGGWRATLSIAAVLVITVILVPLIEQEEPVPVAFDAPNDEVELLQMQSYPQALKDRENKQLSKEKAKKRVQLNAPEAQSEQGVGLHMYSVSPESGGTAEQITAEESLTPMRSATPAPAPASVAADSGKLQQQTPEQESKPEAVGRQKSLLMMDAYVSEDAIEVDDLAPQQWLDHIRQLIEQGEMDTAQKELDEFRLHYPDEDIDPSILEKLKISP